VTPRHSPRDRGTGTPWREHGPALTPSAGRARTLMATSFPGQQTVRCAYPQHYFRIFGKSRISWRESKLKLCSNAERIHRKCLWIFHSVTSPSIPLTDWFNSIVFDPANPATQVYWKPSFSKQTEWATKKLWIFHIILHQDYMLSCKKKTLLF
jgi:hypothetical protein